MRLNRTSRARRWVAGLLLPLTLLAACGSDPDKSSYDILIEAFGDAYGGNDDTVDLRNVVTRANIEAEPTPLQFVEFPELDGLNGLIFLQVAGEPSRWSAPDGEFATILQHGLPIRTHGLGFDLIHADVQPTLAALDQKRGQERGQERGKAMSDSAPTSLVREQRYLRSDNQEVIRRFSCTLSPVGEETLVIFEAAYEVTQFVERCADEQDSFENHYWRDAQGLIWKSKTWISRKIGHLVLERL